MPDRNPLAAIPDSDLPTWLIGWRDVATRERGKSYIEAEHAERAVREFKRDNPGREVLNVYQV